MPLQQGTGSTPIKVENSENHVIPDAIRFDPAKSLENKPKGNVLIILHYFHKISEEKNDFGNRIEID